LELLTIVSTVQIQTAPTDFGWTWLLVVVFVAFAPYRALIIPRRLLPAFVLSGAAFEFTSTLYQSLVKAYEQTEQVKPRYHSAHLPHLNTRGVTSGLDLVVLEGTTDGP
jgi:hypothetical protein